MHRTIHGPDREFLTAAECAAWLGISPTTFKSLLRSGEFPPGVVFGKRTIRWMWLDPVAYAHTRSRMTQAASRNRR